MRGRTQNFDPRQIMHRNDFEIFHYRDYKPGGVDMHHHDFYEVYFFLGGTVEYRVEGRVYHLQPGDLLLINPMELHQPIVDPTGDKYDRIVLWINSSFLEGFSNGDESLSRCFDPAQSTHSNLLRPSAVQQSDLRLRLESLVRERYSSAYGSDFCAQGMLLQFMALLNRLAISAGGAQGSAEGTSSLSGQVLAYISEHYDEELSLESLAQRFYVSKYHLSHAFSRDVGLSVYHYITLKRLLIAKQLLMSGVAPGTVAGSCGFGDYANFYRAFKAQYGISPRDCAGSSAEIPRASAQK